MLLRAGIAAMSLALTLVGLAVAVTFLTDPMEPAAVKSAAKPAVEPLTRSDPGVDPWAERDIPAPRPEPEAQPRPVEESEPQANLEHESQPTSAPEPEPEPDAASGDGDRHRTTSAAGRGDLRL